MRSVKSKFVFHIYSLFFISYSFNYIRAICGYQLIYLLCVDAISNFIVYVSMRFSKFYFVFLFYMSKRFQFFMCIDDNFIFFLIFFLFFFIYFFSFFLFCFNFFFFSSLSLERTNRTHSFRASIIGYPREIISMILISL